MLFAKRYAANTLSYVVHFLVVELKGSSGLSEAAAIKVSNVVILQLLSDLSPVCSVRSTRIIFYSLFVGNEHLSFERMINVVLYCGELLRAE